MNRPLYEVIKKQAHAKMKRFFMPSHAGENISELYESAKYDFTELDFSEHDAYGNDKAIEHHDMGYRSRVHEQ